MIRLGSKNISVPSPSHPVQAPYGLLKEKSLGSISSMLNPETGQEKLAEKIILPLGVLYFIPVFFLVVLILTFVYVGDGLRDAADPHKTKN